MILYHVSNHVNYTVIDPVWYHLGSTAVFIKFAQFAYTDVKRLYPFGQFHTFLDVLLCKINYDKFVQHWYDTVNSCALNVIPGLSLQLLPSMIFRREFTVSYLCFTQ